MKLSKTPSIHRVHDYNLALTEAEIVAIGHTVSSSFDDESWRVFDQIFTMIEKEAEKIANASRKSGKGEPGDRG